MHHMAWQDDTKIHRYTLSEISCATRFRGCISLSWKIFHVSGIQPHPTNICFISHLLKIFTILLSMNLIHLITVSYHQVCQERQFQTQASLLFLTFYARATTDSDPPRGSYSFSQCCLVRKKFRGIKKIT